MPMKLRPEAWRGLPVGVSVSALPRVPTPSRGVLALGVSAAACAASALRVRRRGAGGVDGADGAGDDVEVARAIGEAAGAEEPAGSIRCRAVRRAGRTGVAGSCRTPAS